MRKAYPLIVFAVLAPFLLMGASGLYRIASNALGDSTSAGSGWILATTGGKNGEGFYLDPSALAGSCYWQRNGTVLTPMTVADSVAASSVTGENEVDAGTLTNAGSFKLFDDTGHYTGLVQNTMAASLVYSPPVEIPFSAIITASSGKFLYLNPTPVGGVYQMQWAGAFVEYTDEDAQDAIGAAGIDTTTVDFSYSDLLSTLSWSVISQMSITSDASGLKLSGDATSPGTSYFYGTNGAGTKGWYAQSGITPDTDTDTESYVIYTAAAVTLSTSYQQVGNSYPVCATGTVRAIALNFITWTPAAGTDTVTVEIRIDGAEQGTWTSTKGVLGCYCDVVSGGNNAITASNTTSHYISVWVKKTNNGTTDAITVGNPVVQVAIV